jgi:hypothetical protein
VPDLPQRIPLAEMTSHQLRDAIETTPQRSDRWKALIREAISRGKSFPHSWLPAGVVFSEYTDHSHDGNQAP